jgi:hypothetical protein
MALTAPCILAAQAPDPAQSKPPAGLPANPPTQTAPEASTPEPPQTPAQRPPHRAEITYTQGQLAVIADNSSLNQILREIGRETGIKITGGVTEERVYGKYGPSSAADVLAALLDGTGSNMLLLHTDSATPGELVLTPRQGGPTPPNPNAPGFDDDNNPPDDSSPPPPSQATEQPRNPPPSGANGAPPVSTGQNTPATTDSSDPNSPNGVKTPQQIYDQLQKMRQQQQTPPQ